MTRPAALRATAFAAALACAAAVVACDDTKKPAHPTAPEAAAPTVVTAPSPLPMAGVSTVCLAYMNKRADAQQKLEAAQEAHAATEALASLSARLEKVDAALDDACR
jgi:predicted lipoprotein